MTIQVGVYKEFLSSARAARSVHANRAARLESEVQALDEYMGLIESAQDIMNVTGVLAQTQVKGVIETLVTEALNVTHGDIQFEVENKVVRNQPETWFWLVKEGERYSLKDEVGGSVVDVVAFALRVIFWAIRLRRTQPVMILDEPFKNGGNHEALCHMIRKMSDMLGIQFIIITYHSGLVGISDICYRVSQTNGVSHVERV